MSSSTTSEGGNETLVAFSIVLVLLVVLIVGANVLPESHTAEPDASTSVDQINATTVDVRFIETYNADKVEIETSSETYSIYGPSSTKQITGLESGETLTIYAVDGTGSDETEKRVELYTYTVE